MIHSDDDQHQEEPMSIQRGRDMYDKRTPRQLPLDAPTLRRSRVARGWAMFRATRGGREAREALLASAAREDTETPPPSAA